MKRIAIHSVPRSGSTWLGEIFNSHPKVSYKYQPLFSYAFKNRLTPNSSLQDISLFYNEINLSKDSFINQDEAREIKRVAKFHKSNVAEYTVYKEVRYHYILENLLNKDKDIRIIGLIRNPLAVINSWLNAPKEFRKELGWDEMEEWRFASKKNNNQPEEFNGFEKWKEVANLFQKLEKDYPSQFRIISYSQLIKETEITIDEIFTFCDIKLSETTKQFIFQSKNNNNNDPYSVFKIKKDDDQWKKTLNNIIVKEIISDLKNTPLEKYLTE
ncbi:sulfotransferase domain-containing protein [Vicingus serpentipes]|uniref:Sulfotransferase domain-containing protein n=1 Tax=Vicingus serpentipes TaxID=1926625 RepID=A0A5C6RPX2_9FLAO|nr:sulfotransferase domain-containing protein [Vicingus serpentipes]TXB63700.1 sulfotransferase domain-containing protein [Vicingus serpentipes]